MIMEELGYVIEGEEEVWCGILGEGGGVDVDLGHIKMQILAF